MRALPESGTTSKKFRRFFSLGEIGSEDGDANFGKKINAPTIQSGLGERKTNKQKHDKLN